MFLVQILLPLSDRAGKRFPREPFDRVTSELLARFGGLTAYTTAPARGLWEDAGRTELDVIVVHEVMTETLDEAWWADYRKTLEERFVQDAIVIRALAMQRL